MYLLYLFVVKFRAIVVDPELMPYSGNMDIYIKVRSLVGEHLKYMSCHATAVCKFNISCSVNQNLIFQDPKGNRIKQWLDQPANMGRFACLLIESNLSTS